MIIRQIDLHVKYPLYSSDFNENWTFLTDFRKHFQISNFMKIRPVGAELFHEEGQTDMTKLIVTFSSSANAPKIYAILWNLQCTAEGSRLASAD